MKEIRTLEAHEIECRPQSIKEKGYVYLLYKDARCDMKILDEVFGVMGWKREHEVINGNLFCTISVWDEEKKQWISKQDVGVPSNTEKEKGEASDSMKRACTNLGIGRELYSAPFIWIASKPGEVDKKGDRLFLSNKVNFKVAEVEYNCNREISKLRIVDQNNNLRYTFNSSDKESRKKENISRTEEAHIPHGSANKNATEEEYKCSVCETPIKQGVYAFSKNKYGQPLCMKHQTEENKIGA